MSSRRNRKQTESSSESEEEVGSEHSQDETENESNYESADSASVISSESGDEKDFEDSKENVEIPESETEDEAENQTGSPKVESNQNSEVESDHNSDVESDQDQQQEESDEDSPIKFKKKKKFVVSDSESDEEDIRRKSLYVNRQEELESDTEERAYSKATRRSMGFFVKHESEDESEGDDEDLIADNNEESESEKESNEFLDNEAGGSREDTNDQNSEIESSISEDQYQPRTTTRKYKPKVSHSYTPETATTKDQSNAEGSLDESEDSIRKKPTIQVTNAANSYNDVSVTDSSMQEEQNQSRFRKSMVSSSSTPSKPSTRDNSNAEGSFDKSQSLYSIQDPSESKENNRSVLKTSPFTGHRASSVLTEVHFNDSIASKLSSTMSSAQHKKEIRPKQENSFEIVEVKGEDKNVVDLSDSTDSIMEVVPAVAKRIKETVSRSFYDSEVRKMNDLQIKLASCNKILKSDVSKLPDKGAKLFDVVKNTEKQIEKLKIELKKYEIDDSMSAKSEIARSFNDSDNTSFNKPKKELEKSVEEISWEAINKANDVVPKHTGKKGLQTFQNQQVLTVEKLQTIQESLETCPAENVMAEQPKYLKIDLMNHQKHALAWMLWREGQRPRGGILADDMGLGKTLSLISLILAKKQLEEDNEEQEEESDSESDLEVVEDNAWKAKGRKDFHDGGTLVICPASLLKQWESEINTRVRRNVLGVYCHHGSTREYKARRLAKYDVVITTYSIVMSEKKNNGCVFGVRWNRIICDEAHTIRNHKSQTSEAVCALKGKFRWALTGTPIQNKEFDLYAVIKFLRCSPFDELAYWKTWIEARGSAGGTARLNTLMKSLMLRRTKIELMEKGEVNNLPTKSIEKIDVGLDKEEMNVYSIIMSYSKTLFAQFLHQRASKNIDLQIRYRNELKNPDNEIHKLHKKFNSMFGSATEIKAHQILMLLLRLRQICCHPGLIDSMLEDCEILEEDDDNNNSGLDVLAQLQNLKIDDGEEDQESCYNRATQKVLNKENPIFDFENPSSKIQKLMVVLEEKVLNTQDKAVIVSQWTSFLDVVKHHLHKKRIYCCELNGKVPVKDRNDIVQSFNKQGAGPKIMLLSLTAGGVGLNLVGANHLILLDLHWNPQLESQAQDRIYRFGQQKPVTIYKFVTEGTIEERILHLQEQKLEISSRVLTGRATKTKLTIDDLRGLFGI